MCAPRSPRRCRVNDRLQRFHREHLDKFVRGFGMEESRPYRVVPYQSGQCANANQVIANKSLRHADDENQMGTHSVVAKWNPGATAPNTNDDIIDQLSTGMGKCDAVFDNAGVRPLAREHLFEKSFRFVDLSILREQLDNLAQRV